MHPSVIAGWRQFNEPNEGWLNFMYTDDEAPSDAFPSGIVTVGMGNALESVEAAQALPFVNPDGSPADGATIAAQYEAVRTGPRDSSVNAGPLTTIRLPDAAVQALVEKALAADEAELRRYFPGWDEFPADAQMAVLSKAWAMGPGFAAGFPQFTADMNAGRFSPAGVTDGKYRGVGTQRRQAQEAQCLQNAQTVVDEDLVRYVLYWPGTPVAMAAATVGAMMAGLVFGVGLLVSPAWRAHASAGWHAVKGWVLS